MLQTCYDEAGKASAIDAAVLTECRYQFVQLGLGTMVPETAHMASVRESCEGRSSGLVCELRLVILHVPGCLSPPSLNLSFL